MASRDAFEPGHRAARRGDLGRRVGDRGDPASRRAEPVGGLTQELGVALGPRFDQAVLQRLELVRASEERLLLVLTLSGGAVRTIFVEVPGQIAETALAEVSLVLNERLSGLTLREIRSSLASRLRDTGAAAGQPRAAQRVRAGG